MYGYIVRQTVDLCDTGQRQGCGWPCLGLANHKALEPESVAAGGAQWGVLQAGFEAAARFAEPHGR
jgi:hypothetical protein